MFWDYFYKDVAPTALNQISTTCLYAGTMTSAFGFIARKVSACFVPTGQCENSPAFQRRVKRCKT
jgi:hypothetical protein